MSIVWKQLKAHKYLYLLGLPGMIYFLVFKYAPMYGILIAFQDYSPIVGFWDSEWVGFKHFADLFQDPDFWMILRNALAISLLSLLLFPAPIILALMLNEIRAQVYKRTLQTVLYLPHFLSWTVIVSLTYLFLSSEIGFLNKFIAQFGGERIAFLFNESLFYPIILLQGLWKEVGWETIIYLAAIASVDPALYEAAKMDGAGRFKQIWHITVPCIIPTVVILFILRMGNVLDLNFEQLWLMQNPLVLKVAEVFETFVYKVGLGGAQFSYSTAVGMFKSVVGFILIFLTNYYVNKKGQEGIW
ncbi:ABC transporter permease [Paenibacillus sp. GCM10028914]|uniref:ABC transporter permease n=1 Tax=Paenibacillus sp. GCM10028914 TaxID=3273416 RepID=UPI0036233FB7